MNTFSVGVFKYGLLGHARDQWLNTSIFVFILNNIVIDFSFFDQTVYYKYIFVHFKEINELEDSSYLCL